MIPSLAKPHMHQGFCTLVLSFIQVLVSVSLFLSYQLIYLVCYTQVFHTSVSTCVRVHELVCMCVVFVNPRRACARVIVVVLSVCVCVCVCVCLSVKSHLASGASIYSS